jgi:CubicO group peptidase (beta-lactamase class C family)
VAGSVSTFVHVLAERGLLADATPVAEYWPEFAAHGKQTITGAHVLVHTAGVPQAPTGTTLACSAARAAAAASRSPMLGTAWPSPSPTTG